MATLMQARRASTALRREPRADRPPETELLFGETISVQKRHAGWVFGHSAIDGYEGYVRESDLLVEILTPTHRVVGAHVPAHYEASFKSGRSMELHMNALLTVREDPTLTPEGQMVFAERAGWVFSDQLIPIHRFVSDPAAQALKFVGTAYDWGPRSAFLDCSALTQAAFLATGVVIPRDSGPQSREAGMPIWEGGGDLRDRTPRLLRRNDLVFWAGEKGRHVALMLDHRTCVHCTIAAPYRGVVVQNLNQVIRDQLHAGSGLPTVVRRLP